MFQKHLIFQTKSRITGLRFHANSNGLVVGSGTLFLENSMVASGLLEIVQWLIGNDWFGHGRDNDFHGMNLTAQLKAMEDKFSS